MKNTYFLLLISFFISTLTYGQNKFKTPYSSPEKIKLSQDFETIDASKKNRSFLAPKVDLKTKVIRSEEDNAIIYAENLQYGVQIKNAKKSLGVQTFEFLEKIKVSLKIAKAKDEFEFISQTTDELGFSHIKVQQKWNNIPVYGGEAILHTNASGQVERLNGRIYTKNISNLTQNKTETEVINIALNDLKKTSIVQKAGKIGQLLDLEKDKAELLILPGKENSKLAYEVTVRPNIIERWVYFIDAITGDVLDKYNHTCTLDGIVTATARDLNSITRSFKVAQVGSNYFMIDASKQMYNNAKSQLPNSPAGTLWTINAQNAKIDEVSDNVIQISSTSPNNWSAAAVSAHFNASLCYDYYLNVHKRNSLNGNGGNIISVINISDEDGKGMDNAYWNGKIMGYGNGRTAFKPLAGGLDVAGHEMTHGVVENTAKLEYRNQSGALNESFADIFGALIDRDDWTLGEDIILKSAFPSGAMRSLENPNQGGRNDPGYQPRTMSQYANLRDTPEEDNGGVHINSGIPNFAFYKFATGTGMNKDKAERVYYRVLTNYLTRTSKFTDLRLGVIQATRDLYGDGQEAAAARAAFDFVGISDPNSGTGGTGGTSTSPPPTNTEIPVNPGTESLVVFDPTSDQSIYSGPYVANGNYSKITNALGCLAKPSVTDDGNFVYFVGKDKRIYKVDLVKKTAPTAVSSDAVWRNAAVSKNGKVLAALTAELNPNIYIFDLVKNTGKIMKLFNPTYTTGVKTGEVLYADSFEWDYSGEFLIYDAFNSVKNGLTEIEFWDVGILKAWNPITANYGDGSIEKMFTNLDEGDNIGNPALSKTNTNIIAFDYFNSEEKQFYVLGIDFSKSSNGLALIAENSDVGYPDYSKADKQMTFNGDSDGTSVVQLVNLKADKISPNGKPSEIFTDAKWAVWYAVGQRALPTKEAQTVNITAITDKNPGVKFDMVATASSSLPIQYTVISGDANIIGKTVTCGTTPGKVVLRASQAGDTKFTPAQSEVTFCINPTIPTLANQGDNVVATGGGPLFQYFVNNSPVGGQTANRTLRKDLFGTYTVKSVTADGCQSASSNGIGIAALGLEPKVLSLNVQPNPASETVTIDLPETETINTLIVTTVSGQKILTTQQPSFNVANLAEGAYLINIKTTSDKNYSAKFIKK